MLSNNQNPFGHRPHHGSDFAHNDQPKPTNQLRFYRATGNLSEFGLYFCGGLTFAFVARLIPGMMVFYGLVGGAVALYLAIDYRGASLERQKELQAIALAVVLSVVGGHWDAIWLFIKNISPIVWGAVVALIVAALLFVRSERRFKR